MIVFSTLVYALGKALGVEQATAAFHTWASNPRGAAQLDCLATLRSVQLAASREFPVAILCDAGGSHIGKARSRHFTLALDQPDCIAWITCDDDVAIGAQEARRLVEALRVPQPRVVIVPCALRGAQRSAIVGARGEAILGDPKSCNVEWKPGTCAEPWLRPARWGGFGLVGVNRPAMSAVAKASLAYNELGRVWLRAFADIMRGTEWFGEDRSFFERVPAEVEVCGLVEGESIHAGLRLDLGAFRE